MFTNWFCVVKQRPQLCGVGWFPPQASSSNQHEVGESSVGKTCTTGSGTPGWDPLIDLMTNSLVMTHSSQTTALESRESNWLVFNRKLRGRVDTVSRRYWVTAPVLRMTSCLGTGLRGTYSGAHSDLASSAFSFPKIDHLGEMRGIEQWL